METNSYYHTPVSTESGKNLSEEEEENIPQISIDRTEEILQQIIEIDTKTEKCLKFTGETYKLKALDENFRYNKSRFELENTSVAKENNNLPSEKLFVFKFGDNIGKKHEKILLEKFDTFPICTIGQIKSTFKNTNQIILGTGTLIATNMVLTSASNIFRKEFGKNLFN